MLSIALFILMLLSIFSLSFGLLLIIKPDVVLEIQRQLYEKINWKAAPTSAKSEMRNARLTGIFLIFVTLVIVIFFHRK